jgi:cytochrome c-type biogenesis protein CcmF
VITAAALGRLLILGALLASTAGAVVGFASGTKHSEEGLRWSRRLAYAFGALMLLATLVMEYALLRHDFSVSYVAHVGSPQRAAVGDDRQPLVVAGRLDPLLGLVLGIYIAAADAVSARHRRLDAVRHRHWLTCGSFFSFLIAGPANPFLTIAIPRRSTARDRIRSCRTTC